jgi:hypothetical protein
MTQEKKAVFILAQVLISRIPSKDSCAGIYIPATLNLG